MTASHDTDDWFETALADPARHFDKPDDVLADESLSVESKRRLLQQWEQDAIELQAAASENMAGGEANLLSEVRKALGLLGG